MPRFTFIGSLLYIVRVQTTYTNAVRNYKIIKYSNPDKTGFCFYTFRKNVGQVLDKSVHKYIRLQSIIIINNNTYLYVIDFFFESARELVLSCCNFFLRIFVHVRPYKLQQPRKYIIYTFDKKKNVQKIRFVRWRHSVVL